MAKKLTLERIVVDHGSFVRRALANLGVPSAHMDDVVQAVFLGVARGLKTFDPAVAAVPWNGPDNSGPLRAWLHGICARQAAYHRRAQRGARTLLGAYTVRRAPEPAPVGPDLRLAEEEEKAQLLRLVNALPSSLRAIVQRHELDQQKMSEVAIALGIPVNTAWDRLRRARGMLRRRWARLSQQEDSRGTRGK